MKTIDTLTQDIYRVLDSTKHHDASTDLATEYATRIGEEFIKATVLRDEPRVKGKLWASDIGKPCLRQHWYRFNMPKAGDLLEGHTKFKFLYGNILEEAVLYYAEEAGHTVDLQQHRVEHTLPNGWLISGRIDAVIDGELVDVKTTSSYGFKRYKEGIDYSNDSFGYIDQVGFYNAFIDTPVAGAGFVFIDKQNGHIKHVPCEVPTAEQLVTKATVIADAIETEEEQHVPRGYSPKPYGKSGNESLPIACQYCAFKERCWQDANNGVGLRTFLYNQGPVDFTTVTQEPRVLEMEKAA